MKENMGRGHPDEQDIELLAREALEQSVAGMSAETLSRLNRARQQALASRSRLSWWHGRRWLPVTGATGAAVAMALALALPGGLWQVAQPVDPSQVMPEFAAEVSPAALEDPSLLEDLELMLWLVEVEKHAS